MFAALSIVNPCEILLARASWANNPAFCSQFAFTISNFCIAWAAEAINGYSSQLTIYNGQFVNCLDGINWQYGEAYLRNTLFANVQLDFDSNDAATYAQNATFSGSSSLATSSSGFSLTLTNCILANVPHLTYSSSVFFSGDYNGFYNCQELGTDTVTNTFYPFQTAGADNYYLTNGSPFRDVGTTSIDPTLLAEIQTMTTYAPQDGGFPDTNTPDLGYHYPIIPNDSTGTDFWLAFYTMGNQGPLPFLSLYISSQAGATGTVAIPGLIVNSPLLVVTNCGDNSVNGNYVLTNMIGSVLTNWTGFIPEYSYVKGADWVIYYNSYSVWYILEYDSGTHDFTYLYSKTGLNLNGSSDDWQLDNDPNPGLTPTTICAQIPFSQSFMVATGMVTQVGIPLEAMTQDYDYDVVETNGIHVTASQPVLVYGIDYDAAASAAFTGYPTPLLGTNYCLMAYPAITGYASEFAIVATADDTTVWITPSANADLTGSLWTTPIILNQGQTYQIGSANGGDDVTGTSITSDKPIAVFAGASGANVPEVTGTANPLVQEQLPIAQWGTNVVALSFAGRLNGDTYRVLAASNNTVVTITGNVVTPVDESVSPWSVTTNYETLTITNQAGEFFETNIDGPVQFQSIRPIQVAQFANGTYSDDVTNSEGQPNEGDPCEILLLPTGHWMNSYTVYISTNDLPDQIIGDFDENYINIIVAQSATNSTLLDGCLVAVTNFVAIGSSGYYGAQLSVTNGGAHTVSSSQPVEVQVYGFGLQDAYSYFGGVVK